MLLIQSGIFLSIKCVLSGIYVLTILLTLSIVIDDPHLGGVGLWLAHSNGRRVSHGGHGCGWHHQGRHNTTLLD